MKPKKVLAGIIFAAALFLASSVLAAAQSTGKVTASALNVRSGPGTSYPVQLVIYRGEEVTIEEKTGNWLKISRQGNTYYVCADYVEYAEPEAEAAKETVPEKKYAVVTASALRMREGPGTEYGIITQFVKGTKVEIQSSENGWAHVTAGEYTGYMSEEYLAEVSADYSGISQAVKYAESYLGVPYIWGGASPSGFDCSGLVQHCFAKAGIKLPRTASTQYAASNVTKISKSSLEYGDLVFFTAPGYETIQHVGIYVGGGSFIHANRPGGSVRYGDLYSSYYTTYYYGAVRVN